MKNNKAFCYLLSLFLLLLPNISKANHAAGGEIIYEHLTGTQYRVYFKFYRDCTGPAAPVPPNISLCITESCNNTTTTIPFKVWPNTGKPVSPGCSQYPTTCQSATSTLPGYEEHWYYEDVDLPFQCDSWKFYTFIGNRNTSNNIAGSSGLYFYVETTFNNTGTFQGNSSPYFSIKPIPYVCVNQPFTYNNGAVDVNGDSLVTEIMMPLTGVTSCGNTPIPTTFAPPAPGFPAYNLTNNPIQSNNSFTINSASGQIAFTPSNTGPYIITFRTKEYRNGRLIGYIMRDVQVRVLDCSNVAPLFDIKANTIQNGNYTAGTMFGCINQPLSFCFDIVSSDTDAVYSIEDNHIASVPGSTIAYQNQYNDSVRGCFSWTPQAIDGGTSKSLIITAKDSTCRPPGIMIYYSYTIPIKIWGPTKTVDDTTICPGETAYLNASGGGLYQWSVLPGGDPITSLTNPNIANPIAMPRNKTTYVVTSTINNYCNNNKDTVTVDVLPGLNFQPLNDIITCPGNPVVLDLKIAPPTGSKYSVKWFPSTYLNDDTLAAPTVKAKESITYRVILTSSGSQCKGYDTVLVDILKGLSLNNVDTQICEGQTVQTNITGDSRYTYTWTSTGNPGVFSNANIIDPLITPAPIGKSKYTVTGKYPGCINDTTAEFDIEVQPNPIVKIEDDAKRCFGDTMKLKASVTPTNYPFTLKWAPGSSLSNASIIDPIFKATETTTLTLTASSSAGCTSSDDIKITVFPADFVKTTGDTAICPGTKTQIHVEGGSIKSFRWYPDLAISNKESANPYVNPNSTQVYAVYAVDTNSCYDTSFVKVAVHPRATMQLPDSIILYPGQQAQLSPEGNCTYFSWFPSVGLSKSDIANPIAKPEVNTKYSVTGTTESGCSVKDEVNVIISPESIIAVPNAFRPGHGSNTTLKVINLGDATLKNFSIYNRWGMKVFETKDINQGWDGTYNGEPQPLGVYVYIAEGVTATGKTFRKQGNITLIR
jgi:gliding motility-associated-like protein